MNNKAPPNCARNTAAQAQGKAAAWAPEMAASQSWWIAADPKRGASVGRAADWDPD